MSPPTSVREALIAEALGEVAQLIDRVEALVPAMDEARRRLVQASVDLVLQGQTFERQINGFTEHAKTATARYAGQRTEELTRQALQTQRRAMNETAQSLFASELQPALQRLASPLQELVSRLDRPWEGWVTHAATAAVSSVLTAVLLLSLRFW